MRDGPDSKEPPYALVIDTRELRDIALAHGASGFGVTDAGPFEAARDTMVSNKALGMAGPLHFTFDAPDVASDVTRSFPWARSIVVFSHTYVGGPEGPNDTGAVVARFARHDNYRALHLIAESIASRLSDHRAEILIDDNRLVDRAAAARAGVGWIGKSTMVLAPGHGPWLLIGSVVTDAKLEPTLSMIRDCGSCVACIPACPTGAITERGLDARLCISTWLQSPGSIPHWIRPKIGRRIYGCDDCLTSCPPGGRAIANESPSENLAFSDLLALTDEELLQRFHWWYVPRRDGRFIRRNVLVAAGNSGEKGAVGAIRDHLDHPSSMIRGHAFWAYARSLGTSGRSELLRIRRQETVPEALSELEAALDLASG